MAIRHGAPDIAFVASKRKFASRVGYLQIRGLTDKQIARVKASAGLEIGSVTPDEMVVSILAEMIQRRRPHRVARAAQLAEAVAAAESNGAEAQAPVCDRMVEIATAYYVSERIGETVTLARFVQGTI